MPPAAWIWTGIAAVALMAIYAVRYLYGRRGLEPPALLRACWVVGVWVAVAFAVRHLMFAGLAGIIGAFSLLVVAAILLAPEVVLGIGRPLVWWLAGAERVDALPPVPGLDRALAAMKRHDWRHAEELVRRALAERPDHHDARALLAESLEQQGRIEEAARELAAAGLASPEADRAAARVFRAVDLWKRAGMREPAREALRLLEERTRGTKVETWARVRREALDGPGHHLA